MSAIGGLGVAGAIVGVSYGVLTGKVQSPVADTFSVPAGVGLTVWAVMGINSANEYRKSHKERRGLKKNKTKL